MTCRCCWLSLLCLSAAVAGCGRPQPETGKLPPAPAEAALSSRSISAPINVLASSPVVPPGPLATLRPEVVVQSGHLNAVQAVAFSPDQAFLASVANDGLVKVWDLRVGRELRTLLGATRPLYTVAFHPEGRQLAAAGADNVIYRWSLVDGRPLEPLTGHTSWIYKIAYSPDGRWLASAAKDRMVVVWDLKRGSPRQVLEHVDRVREVVWSPDGKRLVSCTREGSPTKAKVLVRFWDPETGQLLQDHDFPAARAGHMGFNHDGARLAVTLDGETHLLDVAQRRVTRTVPGSYLGFRKSDGAVVSLTDVGRLQFTDPESGQPCGRCVTDGAPDVEEVRKQREQASRMILAIPLQWDAPDESATLTADAELMASPVPGGRISLWNVRNGGLVQRLGDRLELSFGMGGGNMMRPLTIAWSPVAALFAIADRQVVRIVDLRSGVTVRSIPAHEGLVTGLAFRKDGAVLASGGYHDRRIHLWDVETGKRRATLEAGDQAGRIWTLAFAPHGHLLASGHSSRPRTDGQIVLWDTEKAERLHVLDDHGPGRKHPGFLTNSSMIAGLDFMPSGKELFSVNFAMNRLSLWDVSSGQLRAGGTFFRTMSHDVAVSPDGRLLALAGGMNKAAENQGPEDERDNAVLVVGPEKGKILHRLAGHRELVRTVAFSPDSRLLASGSGDATIKLWDTKSGQLVATLSGHSADIAKVCFSPDGRYLLSAGFDHSIRLWDVKALKPQAVMVAVGRDDFVLATADNHYMATRSGLNGVAFRLGNRAVPFEQFDLHFHRPDIVLERLGYATPDLVQDYRFLYQRRLRRMQVDEASLRADYHLPTLSLLVVPPLVTAERRVRLRVRAADSRHLLARLQAFVNDVPAWGPAGADLRPHQASQLDLECEIELSAGHNRLHLSVLNDVGTESLAETAAITCQTPARKPALYILAIGVSRHQDQKLDLDFAAKDAVDVCQLFQDPGRHFRSVHVRRLLDQQVTRAAVRQSGEFFTGASVDDQALVFMAGHGFLDKQRGYYFATHDYERSDPGKSGIPYEDLEGLLHRIPARRKLLLMDTCHAGELDPELVKGASAVALPIDAGVSSRGFELMNSPAALKRLGLLAEWFVDLRRGSGAVVIASSRGYEYAREDKELKNGVFTFAVLEGLKEVKADLDGDGTIRVSELRAYVIKRVQELTRGRQTPNTRQENLALDFPVR